MLRDTTYKNFNALYLASLFSSSVLFWKVRTIFPPKRDFHLFVPSRFENNFDTLSVICPLVDKVFFSLMKLSLARNYFVSQPLNFSHKAFFRKLSHTQEVAKCDYPLVVPIAFQVDGLWAARITIPGRGKSTVWHFFLFSFLQEWGSLCFNGVVCSLF